MRLLALSFILTISILSALGQDRCSLVEYELIRSQRNPRQETPKRFEEWMRSKAIQRKQQIGQAGRTESITYTIPVVIHVIHNGEGIGSGTNISDAQVISQINVLNKDYQRLNADASNTPTEFLPVAGNMDIQFVLAKQDPNGQPTNGIVRTKGTKTSWSMNDDVLLKSISYWPAENYLNIWVTNLASPLVGYSQFPQSSMPGLDNTFMDRLTDGVVIDYTAFGSIADGPFSLDSKFNRGRTATHEVGHFLGLRHIWGDDNGDCSGTDYVNDTPNQANSNSGCPVHPKTTCSEVNMFQNFLDYTNDVCMNLFTKGQVDRMITLLTSGSPRRTSLLTSPGATDPGGNTSIVDAAIVTYTSPSPVSCSAAQVPVITIQNKGTVDLFSFKITGMLNNAILTSQSITTVPITPGQQREFSLNAINLATGTNELHYEVTEPNQTTDQDISNNAINIRSALNIAADVVPLRQRFDSNFQDSWPVITQGQNLAWTNAATDKGKSQSYRAFNAPQADSESWMVSPTLDFSKTKKASVFFDVSYAKKDFADDGLQVLLSTDCGVTYSHILYDKTGDALATTYSNSAWSPASSADWRKDYINLTEFAGKKDLRFAFVATGGNGNNIFLDNIEYFIDDDINPLELKDSYSIYGNADNVKVTFNLEERQPVRVIMYNSIGQVVADQFLENMLNQTYTVNLNGGSAGMYIVKLQFDHTIASTKIFLMP